MQIERFGEAIVTASDATIRCARIARLEDASSLNARVLQQLAPAQFVVIAQMLIEQLGRHKAPCDAYLLNPQSRYPAPALAALVELLAQFGNEEVSILANELQSPAPGEEAKCVRQILKLSDRIKRSLIATLASHWLRGLNE